MKKFLKTLTIILDIIIIALLLFGIFWVASKVGSNDFINIKSLFQGV